jgi:hypothetical protein
MDTDTVYRGWDHPSLIKEYCDEVGKVDVVFAHSMGNLIVGAGIAQEISGCDKIGIENDKIHWYGIEPPLRGSPTAEELYLQCTKDTLIGKLFGKECSHDTNELWDGYECLRPTYVSLRSPNVQLSREACGQNPRCVTIAEMAKRKMKGQMCGFRPGGRFNFGALKLTIQSALVGNLWGEDEKIDYPVSGNDGLVGFSSCRIDGVVYGTNPADPFYAFDGNHDSGTCTGSDSEDELNDMPCKWYCNRLSESKAAKMPRKVVQHVEAHESLLQQHQGTVRNQRALVHKLRAHKKQAH